MNRLNTVLMRSSNGIPITVCYERAACAPFDLYPGDVLWDDSSKCDMIVVGVGVNPPFAKDFIWITAQQHQFRQGVIGRGQSKDSVSSHNIRRASPHLLPEVLLRDLLMDSQLVMGQNEFKSITTSTSTHETQISEGAQLPAKAVEKSIIHVFLPAENGGDCITTEVSGSTTIEDFQRKLVERLYKRLELHSPSDGANFRLAASAAGEVILAGSTVGRFSQLYLVNSQSSQPDVHASGSFWTKGTAMKYWFCDENKWSFQNSFVFSDDDVIYWCRLGERTKSAECSIAVADIREIRRGALCPHAKRANPDLCFTIITNQKLCVNFETQSSRDLNMWLQHISLRSDPQPIPRAQLGSSVLAKGTSFQRFHMQNEKLTSTTILVYYQNERLTWKQSDAQSLEGSIALQDITFIQLGRTGIFLSVFAQDIDPLRCVSIIASSDSLHLVAPSRSQLEDWLGGFKTALASAGRVLFNEDNNSQDSATKYRVIDSDTEIVSRNQEVHANDHASKQFAAKAWRLLEAVRQSSSQLLIFGCSGSLSPSVLSTLRLEHAEVMHVDELQELVQMSSAVIISSVPTANPEIGLQLAGSKLPWVLSLNHGPLTRDRLRFCVELAVLGPGAVIGPPEAIAGLWLCLSNAEPPREARRVVNDKTGSFELGERFAAPKTLRRPSQLSRQRTTHSLQPVQVQVGRTESELYEYTFDFEIPLEMHLLSICEMCGVEKSEIDFQALYHLRNRCYLTEAAIGKSTCSVVFSDVLLIRNQATEAQNMIKAIRRYQKEYDRDCELSASAQVRGETRAEWHERRAVEAKKKDETDKLMYMAMSDPSLLDSLELDAFCEELIANDGLKLMVEALKWVPSPEKAGPRSTAKILLESIGSLVCFESALELLEDEGVDFLYSLIFENSPFVVQEGFMILTTVLELAINGFVMVHTAAQRVAHARTSMIYMRPIQLLGHSGLQIVSLGFFNCLIHKAPTDMVRLSLLQALDRAGLFQVLEHWPRTKNKTSAEVLHKFRELTVSFRPLGPVLDPPVAESLPLLRANQDAVNLASFLSKHSPVQRPVVVAVTHPSSTFVTDGRAGVHCLNGPVKPLKGAAGVEALVAAFLGSSLEEISCIDTVASACAIFGQCRALAHKEEGAASVIAATLDALYRFDQEQAAHTLWFKRCSV